MSFTTITTTQIAAGQPTTQDLFTTIKNDLDDHETRITAIAASSNTQAPICFDVLGYPDASILRSGVMHYRVPNNLTIVGCRLLVVTAGTAGTLQVDVQYKRGAAAFATILTGSISAAFGSGSLFSTAGTLAVTALQTGDLLRLNVSSIQTAMQDFSVIVEVQG